jgi:hypothetical protein
MPNDVAMNCPHRKIEPTLDRWTEAHWNLHQIERNYHHPEPFRYSFNGFVRVIKEVSQILKMDLQNEADYQVVIKPLIDAMRQDTLLKKLATQRDFVVHRGMLELKSIGYAGTTRGKNLKMGLGFDVAPTESSDEGFLRFARGLKGHWELQQMLGLGDEDLRPCIQREWRLEEFGDTDLLELAVEAWRKTGATISDLVVHFGGEPLDLSLSCSHSPEQTRLKIYSYADFEAAMNAEP